MDLLSVVPECSVLNRIIENTCLLQLTCIFHCWRIPHSTEIDRNREESRSVEEVCEMATLPKNTLDHMISNERACYYAVSLDSLHPDQLPEFIIFLVWFGVKFWELRMFWMEQNIWVEITLLPELRVIFLFFFQLCFYHLYTFLDFLFLILWEVIPLLLKVVSVFSHF